jgi:hypothetical protein
MRVGSSLDRERRCLLGLAGAGCENNHTAYLFSRKSDDMISCAKVPTRHGEGSLPGKGAYQSRGAKLR